MIRKFSRSIFFLYSGSAVPTGSHLTVGGDAPAGLATGALQWGRNGAHMAGLLRQLPVRIAIHASQLLAGR